jgi:hypothetical protein
MFLHGIVALPEFIISCDEVKIAEVPDRQHVLMPTIQNQVYPVINAKYPQILTYMSKSVSKVIKFFKLVINISTQNNYNPRNSEYILTICQYRCVNRR